ncbi:MAG: nicotinate-nucleotide adenylyltransferase [Gemmatimonadota bacterium]
MDERLGVLGGTFDPPHIGHLVVAQDALEGLALDRLIVVPSARPPHRRAHFGAEVRLAWARAAFAAHAAIEVSDEELRRPGPSYTVDTLRRLREANGSAELVLLLGADQLRDLGTWREPEQIVRLARIAAMARGGEPAENGDYPHDTVDVTRVDVSSTQIRERLAAGRSIRYLVPESIREDVERAWAEARGHDRKEESE